MADLERLTSEDFAPLPQRIYAVEHERLGALEIFLVPIAAHRCEAVFT